MRSRLAEPDIAPSSSDCSRVTGKPEGILPWVSACGTSPRPTRFLLGRAPVGGNILLDQVDQSLGTCYPISLLGILANYLLGKS